MVDTHATKDMIDDVFLGYEMKLMKESLVENES